MALNRDRAGNIEARLQESGLKQKHEPQELPQDDIKRGRGRPKKMIRENILLKTTVSNRDKKLFDDYCIQKGIPPAAQIRSLIIQFLESKGLR